jgi:adenosine deaminase
VRAVVERLGVRRVQHGVRAIEDPEVVALLVREGVTLDITPISNVKLQVVPSLREHPLRALLAAGVRCTVSTDDPLIFGNTLTDEYVGLATEAGFTRAELVQVARNGFLAGTMAEDSPAPRRSPSWPRSNGKVVERRSARTWAND